MKVVFDYYHLNTRLKSADIVFNFHCRPKIKEMIDAKFYEGVDYAILKEDFYTVLPKREKYTDLCNVLLSFGTVDYSDITGRVLDSLLKYESVDLILHIVLGSGYRHKDKIYELKKMREDRINIYEHIDSMAQLMAKMDIAFVGGGVTLFEAVQMNLPTLVVCAHPYGFELAQNLVNRKCVINLGIHDDFDKDMVFESLDKLLLTEQFKNMKSNLEAFNINGVDRISDILCSYSWVSV